MKLWIDMQYYKQHLQVLNRAELAYPVGKYKSKNQEKKKR